MSSRVGKHYGVFVLLGVVISALVALSLLSRQKTALAQNGPLGVPDTDLAMVEAMPIQLMHGIQGIVLIDKKNYSLCIYQYQQHRPGQQRLVLLAARSFRYDIQLQEYNTAEPTPTTVKQLIIKHARTKKTDAGDDENPDKENTKKQPSSTK